MLSCKFCGLWADKVEDLLEHLRIVHMLQKPLLGPLTEDGRLCVVCNNCKNPQLHPPYTTADFENMMVDLPTVVPRLDFTGLYVDAPVNVPVSEPAQEVVATRPPTPIQQAEQ